MQQFSFTDNVYADGEPYLKGFLGLDWCPSAEAKRNASNYEADIIYMLGQLYGKFVSSRVLIGIGQYKDKKVIIRPRPIPDPDSAEPETKDQEESRLYNAGAKPSDSADSFPQGAQFKPNVPGKEPWQVAPIVGTGKGTNVEINFNPGVYPDAMGQGPFVLPSDAGLLHELVHAMSDVSATRASGMSGPDGYDDLEEFTAVVVANVYRSEVGEPLLGGHSTQPMPLLLSGSQAFYNRYTSYMQQVCANHPWLAGELRKATGIVHNPFVCCTGV